MKKNLLLFTRTICFTCIVYLLTLSGCKSGQREGQQGNVRLYEEEIIIPTYLTGEPEKNPVFYTPADYQGAQCRIYPYPSMDKLTEEKADKVYLGLFLENEYVKVCVLPGIGGRLYMARDKSNGYDFIYYNRVIKPALIGMAGAWISGGIEWNIPHHHRVSTFMPVDYRLVENDDGSKTIWVGEYEKRHQTRWIAGLTLYPDKGFIQADVRLFNTTPFITSSLIWANAAVHANENYQVFFPPDVELATYHHKIEFIDWPVADQFYRGIDFTGGVDVSLWKNTSSPTSFFAWGTEKDFLGGIDHGKSAGTVFIGDRHIWTGKKMWNWGNNDVARLWDEMLTDEDGPYLELMMGAYTDNQPDYSWNDPFSARVAGMYFYPVKEMSGIKEANRDMAMNLEINGSSASIELNTTKDPGPCELRLKYGDEIMYSVEIHPGVSHPLKTVYELPRAIDATLLAVSVVDKDGRELISYSPREKSHPAHPDVYRKPPDPDKLKTAEELYLAGLRLDQFGNPALDPMAYWEKALRIDPENIWVNTQMGISFLKSFRYKEAGKHLQTAADQVTYNHTNPRYGEPLYYLGLCCYLQEDYNRAYELLYKSTWNAAWSSAGYFLISLIDCLRGDYEKALTHVNQAVRSDNNNLEAWQLYAILLRKNGDRQQVMQVLEKILQLDPLNFVAQNEWVALRDHKKGADLQRLLRNEPDNYLELAGRYMQAGFYADAFGVLDRAVSSADSVLLNAPLIRYYLGYCCHQLGDTAQMQAMYLAGNDLTGDYCFPYGYLSEKVLLDVTGKCTGEPEPFYYLGNLYCDYRPEEARRLWKKALELDPDAAVYHRNIAFVEANIFDRMDEAYREINEAIRLSPDDHLYLEEADRYAAYMRIIPSERMNNIETGKTVVFSSDATVARYANLLVLNRRYDEAIKLLSDRHFHAAEESDINLHVQWADAHILRGREKLSSGLTDEAINDFLAAMEFPRNLESTRDGKIALALYYLAQAKKKQGDMESFRDYSGKLVNFESTRGWGTGEWPEIMYLQALACKELGQAHKATGLFNKLINEGKELVSAQPHQAADLRSVKRRHDLIRDRASGHYRQALGYLGLEQYVQAREHLRQTLKLDPAHVGANNYFKETLMY
jgi:tetratricopeptide (TPR) repeat protein